MSDRWQSERIVPGEGEYVLVRFTDQGNWWSTLLPFNNRERIPEEKCGTEYAGPFKLPLEPDPLIEKVEAVTRALPPGCVFQGLGARIIHYVWKTPHGLLTEIFRAGYVTSTIPLSPEAARALADLAEALRQEAEG